jgi:predicted ATPase
MFFSDIQISNYKSYRNSDKLDLARGINIVVGRNNVGKTALLEALSLKFDANPHRSFSSPTLTRMPHPESLVTFTFTITEDELIELLIEAQVDGELYLPLPNMQSHLARQLKFNNHYDTAAAVFGEWFFSHDSYTFRIQREAFGSFTDENWYINNDTYLNPQFERDLENDGVDHFIKFRVEPIEGTFSFLGHTPSTGGRKSSMDFVVRIARLLNRYIYRFKAERLASSLCPLGMERTLAPDARNLAEVIGQLQGNHAQLETYKRLVREVLPEICQVNSRRLDNNMAEVVIWNDERAIAKNEFSFNLAESGSGVGQVLATLYVVLTAREPQVIILDEPQGFLHPGAVRKLVEVLRYYAKDKHQLIIATHSPTVITSADPATVTMIKQENGESLFECIDIKETAAQRMYLSEVGARLSDVFGYDRVLWVEGETEEICFPMILRALTEDGLVGTAILRVQHTGDFNKRKNAHNVIRTYERLSLLEGGLVPPVVGFIFDRDGRSEQEQADLKRLSSGRIHFIGKRLFENYLLNPTGITTVLQNIESQITERQILGWLEQNKSKAKYYIKRPEPPDDDSWTDYVNGALLLEDMFASLTDQRVFFDKTVHSPLLTEWLLENHPRELRELSALLKRILTEKVSTN